MTPEQAEMIDRLRTLLAAEPSTREVPMFGGLSFIVNDKLLATPWGGDLLVRVALERHGELLELPGASPAEMGPERTMGPGWMSVSAEGITGDNWLSFWLGVALENNSATARVAGRPQPSSALPRSAGPVR